MAGYHTDIEKKTEENEYFREVLFTGPHSQLVVMALKPGEDIGLETHPDTDQFFRVEKGRGEVMIDGRMTVIKSDSAILVPAGARHNIRNTGDKPLKLYTLYGPPEHEDGTVHLTRSDAMTSKEHFAGQTTE